MEKRCMLAALLCVVASTCLGRYVSHKSISTEVELINGKEFLRSVINDMGNVREEYSINRVPVEKDDFDQAWEESHMQDARKQRQDRFDKQRDRFAFANDTQAAILEKAIRKSVFDAKQMLQRLECETLQPYLKFDVKGISSPEQVQHMQQALRVADEAVKKMVKDHDMQGLKDFLQKIETWPDLLEHCFKQSVQSAIGQCDDTTSLKELLALTSVV